MSFTTAAELSEVLSRLRLLPPARLKQLASLQGEHASAQSFALELDRRGWLTSFQIDQLFRGQGESLLLGPYVLLDRLGEGGMGQVFKALQTQLQRLVALKVIRGERGHAPEAILRFQREMQAAAQLQHPNVVTIFDAGEAGETLYFVMEYVEGMDLARLVRRHGPATVPEACEYVRQAAQGLEHLRQRGLVHRDIKPSNLLRVEGSGLIKIADLGLARLCVPGEDATAEGSILGTPDFMAPEQALDSRTADIRADLYSLGCTFHFLLAGQAPFAGGTAAEKLLRHQTETPRSITSIRPDVPAAAAAVIIRLLAKKPEDRYQTPAELVAALARTAVVESPLRPAAISVEVAPPTPTTEWKPAVSATESLLRPQPISPPSRRKVALVAAGVVLAGILVLFALRGGNEEQPPPDNGLAKDKDGKLPKAEEAPQPPAVHWDGLAYRPAKLPGVKRWQVVRGGAPIEIWERWPIPSPDGRMIAYTEKNRTVRVHETVSGKLVRVFPHEPPLRPTIVAWSADGRFLAVGFVTGQLAVLDIVESKTRWLVQAGESWIGDIAWSPDGGRLVMAERNNPARPLSLWDAVTGQHRGNLEWVKTHQGDNRLTWSPDGKTIVAACITQDRLDVQSWIAGDSKAGPAVSVEAEHDSLQLVRWASDSKRCVIATRQRLFLANPAEGKLLPIQPGGPRQHNEFFGWDPSQARLALATEGNGTGKLVIWTAGTEKTEEITIPAGAGVEALWFQDGHLHVGRFQETKWSTIQVGKDAWDPLKEPAVMLRGFRLGGWSRDGAWLGAIHNDRVFLWRGTDGSAGPVLRRGERDSSPECLALSPDGRRAVIAFLAGTLRLYELHALGDAWRQDRYLAQGKIKGLARSIAWSPDGQSIVVYSAVGNRDYVEVLKAADLTPASAPLAIPPQAPEQFAALSADGKWFAVSAPARLNLSVWNVADRKEHCKFQGFFRSVLWTPDAHYLAATEQRDNRQETRLWEMPADKELKVKLPDFEWGDWSADSQSIAASQVGSWYVNRHLFLLEPFVKEKRRERLLPGHNGQVTLLAWHPRERWLAAGDVNSLLRVWDADPKTVRWTAAMLRKDEYAVINGDGRLIHASPAAEELLVWVIEHPDGKLELLSTAEFRKRFDAVWPK